MPRVVGAPLVPFRRCAAVADGDERLARFLFALYRWSTYTKVMWGGRRWVAMTYAEWAEELSLSYTQFKYVLEKATHRGFVRREQHAFRGKAPVFIRLTEACRASLLADHDEEQGLGRSAQPGMGKSAQPAMGKSAQPGLGKSAQPLSNSEYETFTETEVAAGAAPPSGDSRLMKAQEIAATARAFVPRTIETHKPDKVSSLEYVWQIGFARRGTTPPALSMKGRGQMRRLIELWSEGRAPVLLAFAVENWADVRDDAETRFGAFDSPREPELGYLVRYAHVVADLVEARKPASRPPPPPVAFQSGRGNRDPIEDPDPEPYVPATLEEVLAIDAAPDRPAGR